MSNGDADKFLSLSQNTNLESFNKTDGLIGSGKPKRKYSLIKFRCYEIDGFKWGLNNFMEQQFSPTSMLQHIGPKVCQKSLGHFLMGHLEDVIPPPTAAWYALLIVQELMVCLGHCSTLSVRHEIERVENC